MTPIERMDLLKHKEAREKEIRRIEFFIKRGVSTEEERQKLTNLRGEQASMKEKEARAQAEADFEAAESPTVFKLDVPRPPYPWQHVSFLGNRQ